MPHAPHCETFQSAVGRSTKRGCGVQRGPGRSQPATGWVERATSRWEPDATDAVVIGRRRITALSMLLRPCRAGNAEAQIWDLAMEGPQRWQGHGSRHHVSYSPACTVPEPRLPGGAMGAEVSGPSSESEAPAQESVSVSGSGRLAVRAKCRANAREVIRVRRAAPSAGRRCRCPHSVAWRKETWCRKAASCPASVRGARRVATRGRPFGRRRRQARAVAGHHIHRCSAPPSPRPHRGQAPCGDACQWPRSGWALGERPRERRSSSASVWRADGRRWSGRSAHASPSAHGPKQARHQAAPGLSTAAWCGEHQRTSPLWPHVHSKRRRCSVDRHRAPPHSPLARHRVTWSAAVAERQCWRRVHSWPRVGAHCLRSLCRTSHSCRWAP